MKRLTRARRLTTLALVLWLPLAAPVLAEVTPDDPVVADVVRMLEAGVEHRLVRSWLESGGKRPEILSASDMIALSAADAPAELVEFLLEIAAQPVGNDAPVQAAPPAPTSQMTVPATASTAPASPAPAAPPAPPVAPTPAARAPVVVNGGDCCLVNFSVEYRASGQQDETGASVSIGDLFLYIDSQFAGRFQSQGNIAGRAVQTFKHRLAPGTHRIRLTRELHAPSNNRSAGEARDHQTIVSPSGISFDVQPGAQWNMDIRWVQGIFSLNDPLSWRWSRNGEKVAGEEKVGTAQDDWPFLCDDVEMSRAAGAIAEWRAADRSKNCVTWASLWPDGVATDRADILAGFRKEDYQPNVSSIGRID